MQLFASSRMQAANLSILYHLEAGKISVTTQTHNPHAKLSVRQPGAAF